MSSITSTITDAVSSILGTIVKEYVLPWVTGAAANPATAALVIGNIQTVLVALAGYAVYLLQNVTSGLIVVPVTTAQAVTAVASVAAATQVSSVVSTQAIITDAAKSLDISQSTQIFLTTQPKTLPVAEGKAGSLLSLSNMGTGAITLTGALNVTLTQGQSTQVAWSEANRAWIPLNTGLRYID